MSSVITAVAVSVISTAISYESNRKSASMSRDQAEAQARAAAEQAAQAQERATQEATLERERIAYESELAAENAAYEIEIAEENARVTEDFKDEQYRRVRGAQIAGAAASGLIMGMGSTQSVMRRTTKAFEDDIGEVRRALEVFSTTRTREAEQVAEGGEFGLEQFLTRSTRETKFEVTNRLAEASMFRRKGNMATAQGKAASYGALISLAGTATKGYALSKMGTQSRYGVLALG